MFPPVASVFPAFGRNSPAKALYSELKTLCLFKTAISAVHKVLLLARQRLSLQLLFLGVFIVSLYIRLASHEREHP